MLVSLTPEVKTGEVWDSGMVQSGDSVQASYHGKALASGQRYCWKVRYWDSAKRPGSYSSPAWFEMGLLAKEEWKGRWIGHADPVVSDSVFDGETYDAREETPGWDMPGLKDLKKFFLVHGEPAQSAALAKILTATYGVETVVPERGEAVSLT